MGRPVNRTTDIFAASAVLWEALVGRRLFQGESEGEVIKKVLDAQVERPSDFVRGLPPSLEALVLRGLARNPDERFATAREMARALERCLPMASPSDVGEYVEKVAAPTLTQRAERMAKIERSSTTRPRISVSSMLAHPEPADTATAPKEKSLSSSTSGIGSVVSDGTAATMTDPLAWLRARRTLIRRGGLAILSLACALLLVAFGATLHTQPEARPASATAAKVLARAPAQGAADPVAGAGAAQATDFGASSAPPSAPAASVAVESAPPTVNAKEAPSGKEAAPVNLDDGLTRGSLPSPDNAHAVAKASPRHSAIVCDPPFTIDANGFRHYKRECL
jgi:serine/threonine-protein kinase